MPTLEVTPLSLAGRTAMPRLLAALAERRGLVALDSAGGAPRRFSLVAFDPLPEALVGPLPADLEGLGPYVARLAGLRGTADVPGPFAAGFVGALAYEASRFVGGRGVTGEALELPPPAWPTPRVVGGLYTDFVVLIHGADGEPARAALVLGDFTGTPYAGCAPPTAARRASVTRALAEAPALGGPELPAPRALGPLARIVAPDAYARRVRAVQARIGRGEVYQVNLAHRLERPVAGHPLALYARLRALAPAPYMGLARWDAGPAWPAGALLSASPELLLEVDVDDAGRRFTRTRPIKGTAPRGADPAADAALRAALLASAKDRAELAMIVDLERNDLARVAAPGSVRVGAFPTLESYRSVHHLVADVTAELAPGRSAVDALASLFPGGSITGAPKLAAMEVIAALEGEGRGFFTGALGCLDVRGNARFNLLIRTLVHRDGAATFHVGGGITWRSDPEAEERETCVKGATLAAALSAVDQPVDTLGAVLADDPARRPE